MTIVPKNVYRLSVLECLTHMTSVRGLVLSLPTNELRFWCHFAGEISELNLLYESWCILIWISLKLAPKGTIKNKSSLVHEMAWVFYRRQVVIWNGGAVYWHIYASLGLDALTHLHTNGWLLWQINAISKNGQWVLIVYDNAYICFAKPLACYMGNGRYWWKRLKSSCRM